MHRNGHFAYLQEAYAARREEIKARLAQFADFRRASDPELFRELCFCILAANSSAEMGIRTLDAIGDLVWSGSVEEIQSRLARGFRYWRIRPAYIVTTREYLRQACDLRLGTWLESFPTEILRRNHLAENRGIKGIGYKEASHFLRNIGYTGCAILDKHILKSLRDLGVIGQRLAPTNPRRYRLIERRMIRFADQVKIPLDELDLLLWSLKTGKILK